MTEENRLARALSQAPASLRLRAALQAGVVPRDEQIAVLVRRCAVEDDFYVRDMLTWALTRHTRERVLEAVVGELDAAQPQARAQALHTLSKLRDPSAWLAVMDGHLCDPNPDVAAAAWRAAVALAPGAEAPRLGRVLLGQFERSDGPLLRSLARALAALGEAAAASLRAAATTPARARFVEEVERIREDPAAGFGEALAAAMRLRTLGSADHARPHTAASAEDEGGHAHR
ncbi:MULTISPECIES: HEAT repeat domain-containing protein [Brevibacterium]|uniref:HEAT repeat domain-containing protein n=1 Tax=Brevibacterium TaxID=1696 RepID=UPI001925D1B9|nr:MULTISPECIES: HEAT repeat domain-containing protein [Brevibacterium]WAL39151.1 HEAT repeat domain-containing protein [Brevibacterium sp. BRM-1]